VRDKYKISPLNMVLTDVEKIFLKIFPRLLPNAAHLHCVWHVNKNIGKRMKPFFRKKYKSPNNGSQRTNYIKSKWSFWLSGGLSWEVLLRWSIRRIGLLLRRNFNVITSKSSSTSRKNSYYLIKRSLLRPGLIITSISIIKPQSA